jgi:hypothetical protein
MSEETFRINIEGCWTDEKFNEQIPRYPGLFFVFEAKPSAAGATLLRLIYVGAADKLREGITSFRKNFDSARYLREGNVLCYHSAWVADAATRDRVSAAFIYAHKPPANDKYKYRFPFPETHVVCEGKIGFLKQDFIV